MCKFAGPAERACWAFAPFGMCVRRIVQNKLVAVSEQNGSLHSGYGAKCKQTRGRQQTQQRKSRSTGPRARLVSDAVARLGQYVQQSLDRTRQTPRCHQISTALINGDGSSSARSGHMTPKVQSEGLRATPSNAANTRTWCGLELVLHSTRFYASHRPGTSTRLRALARSRAVWSYPTFPPPLRSELFDTDFRKRSGSKLTNAGRFQAPPRHPKRPCGMRATRP